MKWRQAIYQLAQSNDYKEAQQYVKRHRNHEKEPVRI